MPWKVLSFIAREVPFSGCVMDFAWLKILQSLEKYALNSHNNDEVCHCLWGLGKPCWNQNARGSVFGLTRGTSRRLIKTGNLSYQVREHHRHYASGCADNIKS